MVTMVTGSGMVGSQAARILLERGERVVLYDAVPRPDFVGTLVDISKVKLIRGDLLDLPHLLHTIKEESIDRIIHTAGFLHAQVHERPYLGVKVNVEGTMNILEASRLTGTKRVVFCSSGTVYGGALSVLKGGPITEDFTFKCLSNRPPSPYAVSKLACEYLGLSYFARFGLDFTAVRFAGVFGPWKGVPGGLPGWVIRDLVEAPALGKSVLIEPHSTYQDTMEFVYSWDAANGLVLACFAPAEKLRNRVYNIGMGKLYRHAELLDLAKKMFPKVKIEKRELPEAGMGGYGSFTQPYDLSAARNEIGYQPKYFMEEAMKDYAQWVKSNLA